MIRNQGSIPSLAARMRRNAFQFLNAAARCRSIGDKIGARDCLARSRAASAMLATWEQMLDNGRRERGYVRLRGLA